MAYHSKSQENLHQKVSWEWAIKREFHGEKDCKSSHSRGDSASPQSPGGLAGLLSWWQTSQGQGAVEPGWRAQIRPEVQTGGQMYETWAIEHW
jgi:hypothetical protein